ncbi:hypothetical protein B1218_36005, partial [Pseudomonas ogarae]
DSASRALQKPAGEMRGRGVRRRDAQMGLRARQVVGEGWGAGGSLGGGGRGGEWGGVGGGEREWGVVVVGA